MLTRGNRVTIGAMVTAALVTAGLERAPTPIAIVVGGTRSPFSSAAYVAAAILNSFTYSVLCLVTTPGQHAAEMIASQTAPSNLRSIPPGQGVPL